VLINSISVISASFADEKAGVDCPETIIYKGESKFKAQDLYIVFKGF
jgi:hypothetical protein